MREITLWGMPNADGSPNRMVYHLPSTWEEATAEHLRIIAQTLLVKMTDAHRRFVLLERLAGIPKGAMALMPSADNFIERVDVTDRSGPWRPVEKWEWRLLPQLDWALQPPTFDRSLLPTFDHGGRRWYGPIGDSEHGFDHMTLDQWIYSTMLLQRFRSDPAQDKAPRNLVEFVAALYVCEELGENAPAYTTERHVELLKTWDEDGLRKRADLLEDLAPELLLAAVLNFEAIHSTMGRLYPKVFEADGTAQQSPQGLFGLAYDAATTGVFGDVYRTEKSQLHRVLGMMEHNLWKEAVAEAEREARGRRGEG